MILQMDKYLSCLEVTSIIEDWYAENIPGITTDNVTVRWNPTRNKFRVTVQYEKGEDSNV